MTTTSIEYHVYLCDVEAGTVAVFRADRPYHRPCKATGIAWRGWRRAAPAVHHKIASIFAPDGDLDRVAEEVAYLALTDWPRPTSRDWSQLSIAVDPASFVTKAGNLGLKPAPAPIDQRIVDAAVARSEAEVELDRTCTLDDDDAIRWLDGDRGEIEGRIAALAERARVVACGVYTADGDHLDTLVFGDESPEPTPEPTWDIHTARAAVAGGRTVDEIVSDVAAACGLTEPAVMQWFTAGSRFAGGANHGLVAQLVDEGLMEWSARDHSAATITSRGRAAYAMSGIPAGGERAIEMRDAGIEDSEIARVVKISAGKVARLVSTTRKMMVLRDALATGRASRLREVDVDASLCFQPSAGGGPAVAASSGFDLILEDAPERITPPGLDHSIDGGALYSRMIRWYERAGYID